jgi:cytochrome P450
VLSPEYAANPAAMLAGLLRNGHPIARSHRGVEVLSYAWVADLLNDNRFHTVDARHFAQKGAPERLLRFVEDGLLLSMTAERHDRVRRVLARAFTLRRVDEQRTLMRQVANARIDEFSPEGTVDLVDEFTDRYPMEVLCRVIGVPSADIPQFLAAAHDLHLMAAVPMEPGFARIDEALKVLESYVVDILDERRRNPRDDFITGLVEAQQIEGGLTPSELVGNVVNLLFAGAGTTRYQLASTARAVLENGMWEALAADTSLVPAAVEEALRFYPVTQFVVRIPDDDVAAGPFVFRARRRVILNLQAASRDPEVFPDPDRFDVHRHSAARSRLPFGWGMHHCLGHALARAAMAEALLVLLDRMTDVQITENVPVAPAAAMLGGPEHVRLSFRWRRR